MTSKMNIVVPTYNSEKWIEKCLMSIYEQSFSNWNCIVINDCSNDNTKDVMDKLGFLESDPRFTVKHNATNVGALQNIVEGFEELGSRDEPESLLMAIDGDDFLFSTDSLAMVDYAYSNVEDHLLTYGNWVGYPDGTKSNCAPYSSSVISERSYRYQPFTASHLRAFKSKLWYKIKDEDLRDEEGKYFKAGWDVAFMIPMLEMAGSRFAFIQNILYCYNRSNPISDFKVRPEKQESAVNIIRSRTAYEEI